MTDFGLPEPENIQTELELERKKYDPLFQAELLRTLNHTIPNNKEQSEIFKLVQRELNSIRQEESSFIFINGPAGKRTSKDFTNQTDNQ